MNTDYLRHAPLWFKIVSKFPIRTCRTLHKATCRLGLHVPVKASDARMGNNERVSDVFCQECMKDLALEEWNKFWKGHK